MIVDYSGEQRLLARQNCSGLFYAQTNILGGCLLVEFSKPIG